MSVPDRFTLAHQMLTTALRSALPARPLLTRLKLACGVDSVTPHSRGASLAFKPSLITARKMSAAAAAPGQPSGPSSFETITVTEAAARLADGTPLLDVRTPSEFAGDRPPGAVNADVQSDAFLAAANAAFPEKDAPILVSCLRGGRSAAAAAQLVSDGYTVVINVAGGWAAWTEAGLPEEK